MHKNWIILLFLAVSAAVSAQPFQAYKLKVSTVFRNTVFKDGPDSVVHFQSPSRMVVLGDTALLIADMDNHRIRRIGIASRHTTTIAGNGVAARVDSIGVLASLNKPKDLVLKGDSVVYFTEEGSHSVRKLVLSTGRITTIAGGSNGFANGIGLSARFNTPKGIALRGDSVLFVADAGNNRIRKIRLSDLSVTTFAGTGSNAYIGKDSLHKDSINIGEPRSVLVVNDNLVFVENDYNHPVLRYIPFSKDTVYNFGGQDRPQDLIHIGGDTVLISSDGGGGNLLVKVLSNPGYFRSIVGFQADGLAKVGNTVYLSNPIGAALFSIGYASGSTIQPFLGLGRSADGPPGVARYGSFGSSALRAPWIYYMDATTFRIRKFNIITGETRTVTRGGRGNNNNTPKVSLAQARFQDVSGFGFSPQGELFVLDRGNNQIRIVDEAQDSVILFSGNRTSGYTNGSLLEARYNGLTSLAFSGANLFVSEGGTIPRIRAIDRGTGIVTTLCGPGPEFTGSGTGTTDSTGAFARFGTALGGLIFKGDTLLAMDRSNRRIRSVNTLNSQVKTYIANSLFDNLPFCFVDKTGSLLSRYNGFRNDFLLLNSKTGPWTSVLGGQGAGDLDGLGTASRFNNASSALLDPATGDVYISDLGNQSIRRVEYVLFNQPPVVTASGSASYTVSNTNPLTLPGFLNVSPGPAWESGQTLSVYSVTNSNPGLFADGPSVNANGDLSLTSNGTNGQAQVQVCFRDNGGVLNGGIDSTCFTIFLTFNIVSNKNLLQSDIRVFPNPGLSGQMKWETNQKEPLTISLIDITGKTIWANRNASFGGIISGPVKGVFLLRFQSTDGSATHRVVQFD